MLDVAIKAARQAGRVLLDGLTREINVIRLESHDIKLEMDREAEACIVTTLRENFPDHAILAEEGGHIGGESDFTWVIDPLDGTYNYSRRIPFWCTSIGLLRGQEKILGVVFDPTRDELFHAAKGKGAFLNGEPMGVSNVEPLQHAVVSYAFPSRGEYLPHVLRAAERLVHTAGKLRAMGSAALHLAYVACGRMDAFFEYGIHPWDVAAGTVLVREAGGKTTLRSHPDNALDIVASNGRIHEKILEQIGW